MKQPRIDLEKRANSWETGNVWGTPNSAPQSQIKFWVSSCRPCPFTGKEIILPLSVFFGAAVLMGKLALEIQWENWTKTSCRSLNFFFFFTQRYACYQLTRVKLTVILCSKIPFEQNSFTKVNGTLCEGLNPVWGGGLWSQAQNHSRSSEQFFELWLHLDFRVFVVRSQTQSASSGWVVQTVKALL